MKSFFSFLKKKESNTDDENMPGHESLKHLKKEELKMIQGIIGLSETQVHEIMKPRIDVVALDINDPIREQVKTIVECGHSRIPVYDENIDDIVGILYAKDLLTFFFDENKVFNLRDILRECFFVPETKRISDLLREFREKNVHIALVVDEYGGFSGIVCLEDILEEIVGEIRDEYDREKDLIVKIDDSSYKISAKISISDLNEQLELELPEEESDSLGGFIMEILGKIPEQGEVAEYGPYEFTIDEMSAYKIEQIIFKKKIHRPSAEDE